MKFDKDFMNSNLELTILAKSESYARSAAEDAFALVERIEDALSIYRESSEVFAINNAKVGDCIKVLDFTMDCLELSAKLYQETLGAFDICMGQFFTNAKKQSNISSPKRISLNIDKENFIVEKLSEGSLDFGAIGKGYAVDKVAELLKGTWGIENALINFASSTIFAIGSDKNSKPWQITLNGSEHILALKDSYAIASSGLNVQDTHIIDPMTKKPSIYKKECCYAHIKNSASYADALSTAFFILTEAEIEEICSKIPVKFYKY